MQVNYFISFISTTQVVIMSILNKALFRIKSLCQPCVSGFWWGEERTPYVPGDVSLLITSKYFHMATSGDQFPDLKTWQQCNWSNIKFMISGIPTCFVVTLYLCYNKTLSLICLPYHNNFPHQ